MSSPPTRGALGSSPAPRLMRLVRRLHLYLGLLLWPFVLLFGITGLSFNHPTVGRQLEVRRVSPDEVERFTGFRAWQPRALAEDVVRQLRELGKRFELSSERAPRFTGFALFAAPAEDGKQVVIVSLTDGSATITRRPEPPAPPPDPLGDVTLELPDVSLPALSKRLEPLLSATAGPLRPHPTVHPELQLELRDDQNHLWTAAYDLSTGKLRSRPASIRRHSLIEVLENVHQQHHYPPEGGPTWWWALFADATALTLIIWAVTGLVMWWQLRRLRKAGLAALLVALALSTAIVTSTMREVDLKEIEGD